jgi:hypothetical protein
LPNRIRRVHIRAGEYRAGGHFPTRFMTQIDQDCSAAASAGQFYADGTP